MDAINKTENLLLQVRAINKSYDKVAKITGENFNIFKVLGLSTSEVRTHSAFISELLNPNGAHEQGNVFVKEFIKILKKNAKTKSENNEVSIAEKAEITFDAEHSISAEVERWLGYNTDTEGGYIDILLTDDNNSHIIIENKIYAGDQRNQLTRYHNFDKNAPIVYITLEGKLPSEDSTNKLEQIDKKLICLSYKTDIISWLEKSKKHTVDYPILRETLTQYIYLIKHLTNQTMKNEEKKEIIDKIIYSKDYIESIQNLVDNNIWYETKKKIMDDLGNHILGQDGLGKELNLKYDFFEDYGFGMEGFDFWFYKEDWKYCIYFYFEDEFETVSYGIDVIHNNDEIDDAEKIKFKEGLRHLGESTDDEGWIWRTNFKEYENISWYDLNINGQKLFKKKIEEIIKEAGSLMVKTT